MEAAPVGKLYVRDPESGEVSLVDADPVTVDSSVEFSGLSDVADPSDPTPFEGDASGSDEAVVVEEPAEPVEAAVEPVEAVEVAVEPAEAVEAVEVAVEPAETVEDAEEVVEESVFGVPNPGTVKRGRPRKTPQ